MNKQPAYEVVISQLARAEITIKSLERHLKKVVSVNRELEEQIHTLEQKRLAEERKKSLRSFKGRF